MATATAGPGDTGTGGGTAPGPSGIGLTGRIDRRWRRLAPYLALVTAWTAMLGSLYFSEVRQLVPCGLCWYQRVLMYPLALLLAIGIVRRDRSIVAYVLPFTLIGMVVSTYHYLVQKTGLFTHAIACHTGVPCTAIYIDWLGFVTISFLALTGFVVIALCMSASRQGEWADGLTRAPWRRVVGSVAAVALFYFIVYRTVH
jgi:disulfide bond formation protein DsbB